MKLFIILLSIAAMYIGSQVVQQNFGMGSSLFCGGGIFIILAFLSLINSDFTVETEHNVAEDMHKLPNINQKKIVVEEDDSIPFEFARVEKLDSHTQLIDYKGWAFVIWKDERGRSYYQEVSEKGGYPIGKIYRGSAQDVAKDIKKKMKRI